MADSGSATTPDGAQRHVKESPLDAEKAASMKEKLAVDLDQTQAKLIADKKAQLREIATLLVTKAADEKEFSRLTAEHGRLSREIAILKESIQQRKKVRV